MTKGNTVLKVSGILLIIFGVLSILFAMWFGFVGALHFEDMGMVLGYGCGTPSMTRASKCPDQAYQLGKSL